MAGSALAYVLRMFPQLSETFVANEIRQLESLGVPLRIFSYRRPREDVPHECVRALRTPVDYLPDPLYRHPRLLLATHRAVRRRVREAYRRALRDAAARSLAERSLDGWRRLLQAGELAERVAGDGVSGLHAHFAHGATDVALLASRLTGRPFGFSAHARDIYTSAAPRLATKIRAASWVVTCTRANRDYLRGLVDEPDARKVELVYHGVDLVKFRPDGERTGAGAPLLLAAGRLVPKKGLPDLVEACAQLRARGVRFRCALVGDGPQRPALERGVRELGLGAHVTLLGSRSQEELARLYQAATLFVLPCRVLDDGDRDGIPNVLAEAMASGLPVVSTRVSGIPELVVDGESGVLVAQRSVGELAAALERLLGDRELRRRLGAGARRRVETHFDASRNARSLAGFFRDRGLVERAA